jgi:ubiquinone biosynthesis protein COQ4
MSVTLDREFAEYLLKTFDDPGKHGVHLLFNEWWRFAPDEVIAKYVADFQAVPEQKAFLEEHYFSEPLDLDTLGRLPAGSVGRAYHDFIVLNGLEKNIAINYRQFHDSLARSGQLDRMPEELRYAIIRGFQIHDLLHVMTGYEATSRGEIALQAFCLAQLRFPYFGMWMSVVTTRMTFLDPDSIVPIMDAITDGWTFGRAARNIQVLKLEQMIERPLSEVRQEYGLLRSDALAKAA